MKIYRLYIFLFLSILVSSISYGGDPFLSALNEIGIFEGFGNQKNITVYEDVSQIPIKPQFAGCSIPCFKLSSIPSYPILASEKDRYLAGFVSGAFISDDYSSAEAYIEANFYVDCGNSNPWVAQIIGPVDGACTDFPHNDLNEGQDPSTTEKYNYCLAGDHKILESASLPPNFYTVSSCVAAQNLCDSDCTHGTDGSNYDVISNLYSQVMSYQSDGAFVTYGPITQNSSGIFGMISYRDRTPPRIFEEGDENSFENYSDKFPDLGLKPNEKIYTGDLFKLKKLQVTDNGSDKVKVKILLGTIDNLPDSLRAWEDSENWVNDVNIPAQVVELNNYSEKKAPLEELDIIPNYCYGYMRYSVLAQEINTDSQSGTEELGNLNPGCATIVENKPLKCYGLPDDDERYEDLGNDPMGAKAWVCSNDTDPDSVNIDTFPADKRVGGQEGLIRISDNDYPNILIRLTSKKDNKQIFFPPCMKAGNLRIVPPEAETTYNEFVNSSNVYEKAIYENVETSGDKPYYTIIDMKPTDYVTENIKNRFLHNTNPNFINKHFRLEDQTVSDTDSNGELDMSEITIGKRNGTYPEVVAVAGINPESGIIIQEDVEYDLDVWVDDSVKWANVYPRSDLYNEGLYPIIIPTGVAEGKVTLNIPNQYPQIIDKVYPFGSNSNNFVRESVNRIDSIVFREPTKCDPRSFKTESDLVTAKLPSITVEARDYSGLTRKIKLYLYITDENANVRTLQRKHGNR